MYNNFIEINKNFQTSVNLELDLYSENKIKEYVPTSDICDVLKKYIKCFLGINKDKATTLVGPYGKGKSFLLLVLTYLVGKNKNTLAWESLHEKIKSIDSELYNLLTEIKNKDISLLPILINSNFDNISQSFLLAISDALKREGMNTIIPKTTFSVCLELITKWESDPDISKELLKKCLEKNKIDLPKLKIELKNYSNSAYKQFENLYNCISKGIEFNPLINNDLIKTIKDISFQISDFGYNGVFIIFDEFSKFIESTSTDLMKDLKIVQDLAETSTRSSKTNQIHLCCVTHKSISLYKSKNEATNKDAFKTVEGRFTEIRFNRSLEENYQIIANGINKKKEYNDVVEKFLSKNNLFYESVHNLNLFNDNEEKLLYHSCFPLNPISVYLLIQISELVAQNERTLFTFLSDNNDHSFNYFIKNNDEKNGLLNIDKIFDYFSELLKDEETNSIRNVWYRAVSILAKEDSSIRKKIIKAIALLQMINDTEKLPCKTEVIAACLMLNINETEKEIEFLIDNHILRKNLLNNLIIFAASNTKYIDDRIEVLEHTKYKSITYSFICNQLPITKFLLPRKYNEANKITRFFKIIYLTRDELKSLKSFKNIFNDNFCDGVICRIIGNISIDELIAKSSDLKEPRVIFQKPNKTISDNFLDQLKRYICLKDIYGSDNLDDIAKEEIDMLIQESNEDINNYISSYYSNIDTFVLESCKYENVFIGELMSDVLTNYFKHNIVFNNELINRRNVSSQYQKAANNVIDCLINHVGCDQFSPTSPEQSIIMSILDDKKDDVEFRNVINFIKFEIAENDNAKVSVQKLVDSLTSREYGIREGIIPILLAKAISELSDNVLLYFDTKEIMLNSVNLTKSIKSENYYFKFSKGSKVQLKFLSKMLNKFKVHSENSFRIDVQNLSNSLKKYFLSQPNIIRVCNPQNNFLNCDTKILKYKNIFNNININPFEVIFIDTKDIFETNNYEILYKEISLFDNKIDQSLTNFKKSLVIKIKDIFGIDDETSLKMGMGHFIKNKFNDSAVLLEDLNKKIFVEITNQNSFNDNDILEELSRICVGQYIEDWEQDNSLKLISLIDSFVENLSEAKVIKKGSSIDAALIDTEINDPIAELMLNNVQSIFEEYSDSVSTEDKLKILSKIMKDLM